MEFGGGSQGCQPVQNGLRIVTSTGRRKIRGAPPGFDLRPSSRPPTGRDRPGFAALPAKRFRHGADSQTAPRWQRSQRVEPRRHSDRRLAAAAAAPLRRRYRTINLRLHAGVRWLGDLTFHLHAVIGRHQFPPDAPCASATARPKQGGGMSRSRRGPRPQRLVSS